MIPVLAQRAASEGPRWTRAVGIIPVTPYKEVVRCGLAGQPFLSILRKYSPVASHARTIEILALRHEFQHPVKKRMPWIVSPSAQ